MLIINQLDMQKITEHSEEAYPEECCGLLLGKLTANDKIVSEVYPTENVWGQPDQEVIFANQKGENLSKKNRFAIAPKAMLAAQKIAVQRQETIIAVYHSHPDNLPQPSDCDRTLAWEQYSYIIMSVINGKAKEYRSWVLNEDEEFEEEEVQVVS